MWGCVSAKPGGGLSGEDGIVVHGGREGAVVCGEHFPPGFREEGFYDGETPEASQGVFDGDRGGTIMRVAYVDGGGNGGEHFVVVDGEGGGGMSVEKMRVSFFASRGDGEGFAWGTGMAVGHV